MTEVNEVNAVDLLEELVRIDSANPSMGGPGEQQVGERVAAVLRDIGCEVQTLPGVEGTDRRNIVATLRGASDGPVLLLEAHLDTVAQTPEPQPVRRADERIYGRGSCDTKGSAAAMIAAISRIAALPDHPTVVFAGAVDEEVFMQGARALGVQLPKVDAAIVGEPTSLLPVRVHNGMIRFRIVTHGAAVHTSRSHLGVNAIAAAARVVLAIQDELLPELHERAHPLAGPALITAAVIHGGVASNLVPDRCEIDIDRRLGPGEDPVAVMAEIDELLDRLRAKGDDITREEPAIEFPAVETPSDHTLVRLCEEASENITGEVSTAGGVPYGTDASYLSATAGIPCVVLGPGSIDQAHTENEWVPIEEVEQASRIYEDLVMRFARDR
jgi:acetylornithine deacetylase